MQAIMKCRNFGCINALRGSERNLELHPLGDYAQEMLSFLD
jgi:hypothetical protein